MSTYQMFVVISFIVVVSLYIIYLFQRRKEQSDNLTTDKIVLALRELGKRQPDFADYLRKIGLL